MASPTVAVTVHRVPFSTNVERIALAAAHKSIAVRWIDHDPGDRDALIALSGQPLVPVLEEDDGRILTDSPAILARLEQLVPEPALWPADPRSRAEADVFVDWFNRVWKLAPNALAEAEEAAESGGDPAATGALAAELRASRDRFEALLTGRDHLLTDGFGIADVIAWPFLRYATGIADDDPDRFHAVLHRELRLTGEHPRLAAWIDRVARRSHA